MYVLVVSRGAPSASDPLRGVFELDQAKALRDAGLRVVVAALDARSIRHRRQLGISQVSVEGIDVVRLDVALGRLPAALDHAAHAAAMARLWRAVVHRFGPPDLVHAHFSRYAAALVRAGLPGSGATGRAVPLVVTEHDSHLRPGQTSRLRVEDCRVGLGGADRVLAVSSALAAILSSEYGVRAEVVPDVVDIETFAPHPTDRRHRDLHTLVSVGNLIDRKGMVPLCRTVIALGPAFPELRLRILGEGPQRAELEGLLARQDLGHRITLVGRRTRGELARELAGAGGFALFSRWETFGVAHAEALASGTPVLSTPCGGPEGFIGPGDGVITSGFSDPELRAGLTGFLGRLAGFDRDEIARQAAEQFSPQALAGRLGRIYSDLLEGRR